MENSFAVLGIVIAEPGVGATIRSTTYIELYCLVDEVFDSRLVLIQFDLQSLRVMVLWMILDGYGMYRMNEGTGRDNDLVL
ncbi:hypothetical protein Tco_0770426 [Tanacetum coccineum]|uniref:Uncharacterized protein n=1 Tax=Tanacetum coccineum TaxID=301880 RepID=A0ABQ4ZFJ5_9ASTR